jgi:hypothetical protein
MIAAMGAWLWGLRCAFPAESRVLARALLCCQQKLEGNEESKAPPVSRPVD